MTQPMAIFSGADKDAQKAYATRQLYESVAMRAGAGTRRIYLNGGSDSRRATAEYWQEWAGKMGVPFARCGWCVILGQDALSAAQGQVP